MRRKAFIILPAIVIALMALTLPTSSPRGISKAESSPSQLRQTEAAGDCRGDVNLDGTRNVMDVVLLLLHVKRTQLLTGDGLANADVDGNGTVDMQDVSRLRRGIVGLETLPACAAAGNPRINAISPGRGLPGSNITISGANFGIIAALNTVKFGNDTQTVSIVSASATQLVVTVPSYSSGGFYRDVTVTTGGKTSNPMPFVIDRFEPTITVESLSLLADSTPPFSIAPTLDSGDLPIQRLQIRFLNATFDSNRLVAGSSLGMGYMATGYGSSASVLVFVDKVQGSVIDISIEGQDESQRGIAARGQILPNTQGFTMDLTFESDPTSVNQMEAMATSGRLIVYFDAGRLQLPAGGTTFNINTTATSRQPVGGQAFTKEFPKQFTAVTTAAGAPVIEELQPFSGSYRQEVEIIGSGFSGVNADNRVTFAGANNTRLPAPILSASETSLIVVVPAEAITGPVQVERSGRSSNSHSFWIPFSPSLRVTLDNRDANSTIGLRLDWQEFPLNLAMMNFDVRFSRSTWNYAALTRGAKLGRIIGSVGGHALYYDVYVEQTDGSTYALLQFKDSSNQTQEEAKILLTSDQGLGPKLSFIALGEELAASFSVISGAASGQLTLNMPVFRNPAPGPLQVNTILTSYQPVPGQDNRRRMAAVQTINIQ